MSEDLGERTPHLRDLPSELVGIMREEWASRTTYGKLLYPLWIVDSVFQWIGFLVFFAFIAFAAQFAKLMNGGSRNSQMPEVYKDD